MIEAQITSQGPADSRGQVDGDCECRVASRGLGPEPKRIIVRGVILEMIVEKLARETIAPRVRLLPFRPQKCRRIASAAH